MAARQLCYFANDRLIADELLNSNANGKSDEELIANGPTSNLSEQLFSVVSWGCAATHWLAHALNTHQDFLRPCRKYDMEYFRLCTKIDGVRYMRLVGPLGYGHPAAGNVHGVSRDQIPLLRQEFGKRYEIRCYRSRSAAEAAKPVSPLSASPTKCFGKFERYCAEGMGQPGLASTFWLPGPASTQPL